MNIFKIKLILSNAWKGLKFFSKITKTKKDDKIVSVISSIIKGCPTLIGIAEKSVDCIVNRKKNKELKDKSSTAKTKVTKLIDGLIKTAKHQDKIVEVINEVKKLKKELKK